MSGATQPTIPVAQRLVHVNRRARRIALIAVGVFCAIVIALSLALGGAFSSSDEGTAGTAENPTTVAPSPGVRYDGGPEEGTRGASASAPASRYDGGPEEGTRGPNQ